MNCSTSDACWPDEIVLVLETETTAIRGRGGGTRTRTNVSHLLDGIMQFDHEKLDVYQLELEFIAWVSKLLTRSRAA